MKNRLTQSLVLSSFLTALPLAGNMALAQSSDPIIIGLATAKTGIMASYDGPADAGAKLAVADINANGGVLGRQLQLVSADTQSDVAQGAVAAAQVIEEGAQFVIVSCDFDQGAPATVAATGANRIAFSTCAASPKFDVAGLGPLAYTMATAAPAEGKLLAQFAYKQQNWRKAYVLFDTLDEYNNSICAGFKEEWSQLGGTLTGEDTFVNSDASIAAQVTRFKSTGAESEFIFMCSSVPGGVTAIRQLRAAGVDTPIVTDDAMDGNYWLDAVPNLNNVYLATYASIFGDDANPKVNQFVEDYKKLAGAHPDTSHAATGYSVIEALALAIEQAGSTDTEKVQEKLNSFKDVPLLVGPTSFSADSHINSRSMAILHIQDGAPRFYMNFDVTK